MRNRKAPSRISAVFKKWGVDIESETFGPGKFFSKKSLLKIASKRRCFQAISVVLTVCVLIFVFTVSPPHLDVQLPQDSDLLQRPYLRKGLFDFTSRDRPYLTERIIEFMQESCTSLPSYDILFCRNVLLNAAPFEHNCFMFCNNKTFYANVAVKDTDSTDEILCTESYATVVEKRRRLKRVVVSGERFYAAEEGAALVGEEFTRVPKDLKEVCLFHHAVDILHGTWLSDSGATSL